MYNCDVMRDSNVTNEMRPIVIRRSVAVFIIRIILLELVFEIIYLSWRTLIHFLPTSLETTLTLNVASLIFFLILVTVIQNILLIIIALNWSRNYYEFRTKDIAQYKGILTNTKQSYEYRDIQSISVHQSILGRMFNYGSVTLYIPTLGHDVHFNEVSNPTGFVALLKSIKPDIEGARYILKR